METGIHETPEEGFAGELGNLLYHRSRHVLEGLLEHPRIGEQHLLVLLSRKDLPREIVSRIARNREWMSSYQIKLAVAKHPRAPREVTLRLLKFIYLFDLLGLARTPGAPAELKRLAEDAVLSQKEGLALGQRISLARMGTSRLAARLLTDPERRVIEAAMSNPSLTEHGVASALLSESASADLTRMVVNHPRWSASRLVKLALVRSRHLSLGRLMAILPELSPGDLADLVSDRRAAVNIRAYAARIVKSRANRKSAL